MRCCKEPNHIKAVSFVRMAITYSYKNYTDILFKILIIYLYQCFIDMYLLMYRYVKLVYYFVFHSYNHKSKQEQKENGRHLSTLRDGNQQQFNFNIALQQCKEFKFRKKFIPRMRPKQLLYIHACMQMRSSSTVHSCY